MKNVSLLALAFLLLLFSPLLFGAATIQPGQHNGQYQIPQQQSLTDGLQYSDNVKLVKLIKELETQLIAANNHIIKLYQYLEKKSSL